MEGLTIFAFVIIGLKRERDEYETDTSANTDQNSDEE